MLRKKLSLLILALVATMTTQANNDYSTLVVETKSGTTLELSLQKKPKVQISETEFIIYFDNKAEGYVHEEVRKFYFKPYNATNIEAPVEKNTIRVSMIDQTKVVISGVSESSKVRLFTMDGKAMKIEAAGNNDEITVSLDALAPGTYLLNIDNKQTFKLLKR